LNIPRIFSKRLTFDRVYLWILQRRKRFNFEILTLSGFDRFIILLGMSDLYVLLEGAHIKICLVARSSPHETSILDSLILYLIFGFRYDPPRVTTFIIACDSHHCA